jgi:anaerobic magnesium-protoporphyrin IX monomethyl ester cyclase
MNQVQDLPILIGGLVFCAFYCLSAFLRNLVGSVRGSVADLMFDFQSGVLGAMHSQLFGSAISCIVRIVVVVLFHSSRVGRDKKLWQDTVSRGFFVSSYVAAPSTSIEGEREVLLVYPGKFKAPDPQVPLSLLYLAGSLMQEGFGVRIFDMRLEDYRHLRIANPLFVGISCMTGLQIRYALEFAEYVRAQGVSCPIVWGGIHPTLLPDQTVQDDLVDIVVSGEGELIVKDLAKCLYSGNSICDVAGVTFESEGEIRSTAQGKIIDLDAIPVDLPYELLQIEKYPAIKSGRIHIQTSRGCPHRCGFCYNTMFNNQRWRGKSAKRVLDEIEYLMHRFSGVKIIDPIDDNFFVDKKRVEDICQGILDRGLAVHWRANCRFDYCSTYDRNFLSLLEKAGCVELDFGGESGSTRLQEFIHKDVTAEQMLRSVEALKVWAPSIEPYVSWMSGLPGETDTDLAATFDLMDRMSAANPKTQHYGVYVYTPFPSPVLCRLPSEFSMPRTLREWSEISVFHFDPPWHSKRRLAKLHAISAVTRCAFYPEARINQRGFAFRLAYGLMNKIARYRWKHRCFGFPIELRIVSSVEKRLKGFI